MQGQRWRIHERVIGPLPEVLSRQVTLLMADLRAELEAAYNAEAAAAASRIAASAVNRADIRARV